MSPRPLDGKGAEEGTNSSGVYRIPYYDGTPVRCTADDTTHSPPNRIDLAAQGDDRFNLVVATADGIVRLIVDNFCENPARSGSLQQQLRLDRALQR